MDLAALSIMANRSFQSLPDCSIFFDDKLHNIGMRPR